MNTEVERYLIENSYKLKTPFYLLDDVKFARNMKKLHDAFTEKFEKFRIAYSVKTNPNPKVLQVVKEFGAMAECVSTDEVNLSLKVGFDYENIVFNGIIPSIKEKFNVAFRGGIVNVDNWNEFRWLEEVARENNTPIDVGLRINVHVNDNVWSRFGVEIDGEEYNKIVQLNEISPFINIVGVHSHIYDTRELESWHTRALNVAKIAKKFHSKFIDMGSCFYGCMDERLKEQFSVVHTFDEYAETVRSAFEKVYDFQKDEVPFLILEPGTPVIADAVTCVSKISNIKRTSRRHMAILDVSIFDIGFVPRNKNTPVDILSLETDEQNRYDDTLISASHLQGYTCVEKDLITWDYNKKVTVGDIALIRNIGAYSDSMASNFIKKKPQMYTVSELIKDVEAWREKK